MDEGRKLFESRRFDEAVIAYRDQLGRGGDRLAIVGALAKSLVAAGRYAEAIPYLEEAGTYEKETVRGSVGRDIPLSVCEWLTGNRDRALELLRPLAGGGKRGGTPAYAVDRAGGVTQGLLLRYMSFTHGSESDYQLSVAFLAKLAAGKDSSNWPGPVARFAFGKMPIEEVLARGTGVGDLVAAKQIAAADLLKRRQLTNVLFNAAVNCRVAKDESRCRDWMRECASLVNPIVECEWHLAQAEVRATSGEAGKESRVPTLCIEQLTVFAEDIRR